MIVGTSHTVDSYGVPSSPCLPAMSGYTGFLPAFPESITGIAGSASRAASPQPVPDLLLLLWKLLSSSAAYPG